MNACQYCGSNEWASFDNNEEVVLCANCFSPEALPAVPYDSYLAIVTKEQDRNKKLFTEGEEPSPYESPEYYDKMREDKQVEEQPTYPPFWALLDTERS